MSTLLSFDQASKTTGWACFQDNKLLTYGKFTLDDDDVGVRLTKFRTKVQELINQYQPDEVVFEDIQEQNNIQTFKVLAQVYGVMSELLTSIKMPHSTLLAVQWKSDLKIKGKARAEQKRNAQQYVQNTYSIKATQDESDAICIGTAYLNARKCAW